MRASTVFIVALALLLGLGAVAVAKYAGLFTPKKETPPPPAEKPPPEMVLVAGTNLYEDVRITLNHVILRELRPNEKAALEQRFGANWKEKLLPALVTAADGRLPLQNIPADTILFKDYFAPATLPDRLTEQLAPNTRAVNVSVQKNRASGGQIRVGEYVDVLCTSKVFDGVREEIRTACIARNCKVIMKRNSPWGLAASDPDDKPLNFTLQANVYRAALIEYAQTLGQIALQPVPTPPKTDGTFSDATSKEYATEDKRIEEIKSGERTIGDEDLVRIFKLVPPPIKPVIPPTPPYVVEHITGVNPSGKSVFKAPEPTKPSSDSPPTTPPVIPAGGTGGAIGATTPTVYTNVSYSFRPPTPTNERNGQQPERPRSIAVKPN